MPVSRCVRCGNRSIRPRVGAGRFRPFRMMPALPVPADFPIPVCTRCYTEYIDGSTAESLTKIMTAAFEEEMRRRARNAVAQVCTHISQRKLEKLLGLSQGYLCRLHGGHGTPSAALVALLTLLAREPYLRLREVEMIWVELQPDASLESANTRRPGARHDE